MMKLTSQGIRRRFASVSEHHRIMQLTYGVDMVLGFILTKANLNLYKNCASWNNAVDIWC